MSIGFRRGDRLRIRGERWLVTTSAGALLHVRGCDRGNRHQAVSFLAAAEHIEPVPPGRVRGVRPSRWRRVVRQLLADAAPVPASLLTAARARLDLLPYQLEPALAWIRGDGVRLLVADDVGLGKTVQAGLVVSELLARRPGAHVLIVTPAGLREQWRAELASRFGVGADIVDSAFLSRSSAAALAGVSPWIATTVVITSIDFVKRPEVLRSLEPVIWDLVVCDEAHALSGRSDRHAAAAMLAERTRGLVLLSATPHSGDPAAFERLTSLGDPDGLFPLVAFRRTRRDVGAGIRRRSTWLQIRMTPAERRLHAALSAYTRDIWHARGTVDPEARLVAIVLTRRLCSSTEALSRSVARRLALLDGVESGSVQPLLPFDADEPDDAVLAVPGLTCLADERQRLEALLDLAGAAPHDSKVAALRRLLDRTPEPAIVFTEYRDTLDHLADRLAPLRPLALHGGLGPAERRDAVRRFTDGDARLLLATDAASEGLNLQRRCRLVINLDLPWSPLRLEQRIGRVERIGQHRRVHAIQLVGRDTAEAHTVRRLIERLADVDAALGAIRAPAVTEDDVGAAVIAGAGTTGAAVPLPAGIVAPSLRTAADAEAGRILVCRALAAGGSTSGDQAVQTRLRGRLPAPCLYGYRVTVVDAGDEPIWETLFGIAAAAEPVAVALTAIRTQALAAFHADDSRSSALAIQRELALIRGLRARQARLAATLGQRGLFDARAERATEARAGILREALVHCEQRLEALRRRRRPAAGGVELAFAALAR